MCRLVLEERELPNLVRFVHLILELLESADAIDYLQLQGLFGCVYEAQIQSLEWRGGAVLPDSLHDEVDFLLDHGFLEERLSFTYFQECVEQKRGDSID